MAGLHVPLPLGGKRRRLFGRLCALALAQAGLMGGGALLVKWVFDNLFVTAPITLSGTILTAVGALLMIPLLGGWLRHKERVWAETLGQEYTHAVRLRLYDRLGSLAPRDLQAEESGGHLLRFIGDLTALRQWMSLGLARISAALITMTVCLGVLGYISPALGGAVALVVATGAGVAWMLGSRLRASLRFARRQRARLATDISERIAAMPVIQAFSQVRRERFRVARRSTDLKNAMLDRARIVGILRGVTEGVTGFSIATILLVGAHEVSVGRTTLGAVVAAISMLGILVSALRDIGRSHEYWHAYFRQTLQTAAQARRLPLPR